LRTALRARHYSRRTEQAYWLGVERYVRFNSGGASAGSYDLNVAGIK
jgi:hypothetical protein